MINLTNNRLAIHILEPGSDKYKRSRFDWSGNCEQIILDGEHTYCSQEAVGTHRGCEGIGLCNEFGIVTAPGYDEAAVSERFPKIGIGFLQKKNNLPYHFAKDYDILPVDIVTEQRQQSRVIFTQTSPNNRGWAWKIQKTLSIKDNILTIEYVLENTGQKPIVTEEYCHNFFSVNRHPVGPDYLLETSFPVNFEEVHGAVAVDGSAVEIAEIPSEHIYAAQSNCAPLKNVRWKLLHRPSSRGIQVTEHYRLHKFAVWGMSHVISPEFFIRLDILPGKKQEWKRTYAFF